MIEINTHNVAFGLTEHRLLHEHPIWKRGWVEIDEIRTHGGTALALEIRRPSTADKPYRNLSIILALDTHPHISGRGGREGWLAWGRVETGGVLGAATTRSGVDTRSKGTVNGAELAGECCSATLPSVTDRSEP